jgi:O-acetyl-ADP-ribose deacetylase (regulator of RNase III)
LEECREIRRTRFPEGLPTGEAVITTAGRLPSRFVIHTVGPVYGTNEGRDAELLAAAYRNSLDLAVSRQLSSIAFPAISTGVYGYPKHEAAAVVLETIAGSGKILESLEIRLVFFSEPDARQFLQHAEGQI